MTSLLAEALVDEDLPSYGCDCWCACYARVDLPDTCCLMCEQGDHVLDDAGGEG